MVVNDEYWPAFEVFTRCESQWTLDPAGRRHGLYYPSVEIVIRARGLDLGTTLDHVHYLELGARMAYNGASPEEVRQLIHGEDL